MSALYSWAQQRNNLEPKTPVQEEVYLACKVKSYLKIRAGCSERCLGILEIKSQKQKNWICWAAWIQGKSYKGKRQVQDVNHSCPLLPWFQVLRGLSELKRKKAKIHTRKKKAWDPERESTGFFVLRIFIYFLKAGILEEISGEDLINFPGVSFNLLIHQNECIRSELWSLSISWY